MWGGGGPRGFVPGRGALEESTIYHPSSELLNPGGPSKGGPGGLGSRVEGAAAAGSARSPVPAGEGEASSERRADQEPGSWEGRKGSPECSCEGCRQRIGAEKPRKTSAAGRLRTGYKFCLHPTFICPPRRRLQESYFTPFFFFFLLLIFLTRCTREATWCKERTGLAGGLICLRHLGCLKLEPPSPRSPRYFNHSNVSGAGDELKR